MNFKPGDIIRFTYDPQDVDENTGDRFKEVLVLNPLWKWKMHGIDLKRLTPAERAVLEAVLDPEQKDKPHHLPLVNDIKRRMDPIELINNPVVFYSKFVKPFLRRADAYRQYVPKRMTGISVVKDASIKTGKKPIDKPLFGPKTPQAPEQPKALTPIDIMKQNAAKKGQK